MTFETMKENKMKSKRETTYANEIKVTRKRNKNEMEKQI